MLTLSYRHPLTDGIWWYYMIEISFYVSLTVSQFFDVKRKDFWEMFVHHIATISLMTFSWTVNLTRIGTLILLVHDVADGFLEVPKCFDIPFCFYLNRVALLVSGFKTGPLRQVQKNL